MENNENKCYNPDCHKKVCTNPEHFNYICMNPNCHDEHCDIKEHYNRKLYLNNEDFDLTEKNNQNKCYNPDCEKLLCKNPGHYNFICMDPNCEDEHCEIEDHYNKQLLIDYQNSTDFSVYDNSGEIDYDEDVELKLCSCDDCSDEENHNHTHEHSHNHTHEHSHNHTHEHSHEHTECHDVCCSHETDDIKLCNCDDCDDEEEEEPVIAEGKPLLANRSIQIILSSGILFALGHIFEYLNVMDGKLSTIIFMVAAVIAGYEIAIMAYNSITKRHTISPAVLMCIACIASFLIGCPEEGAAVTFLYYIAEFLEDYSELRAQNSIKSLVEIAPETARVKVDDSEEIRKVDDVELNEIVIVKPGDKIPLDGKIIKGTSSIDQASITGESVPITKNIGDKVYSGTVNQEGYLEIEVTKKSKDSVISNIVNLVKRSQLHRSSTETLVEKIAKYYTPIIIIITICVAVIPPLFMGGDLRTWVYRALSIMVISCPCAFLISTPIGMVSAITSATRQGVIIKGSSYVEEMRNIDAVIFDKTGTLTEGKLEVADVHIVDKNYTEDELIQIAASLERRSTHPIGLAILNYAQNKNIHFIDIQNFRNIPGKGILGQFGNSEYYAANESLIDGSKFNIEHSKIVEHSNNGKTLIFVGNQNNLIGVISVKDKIRKEAKEVIGKLNDAGIKTVMLSGDNKLAAKSVADKIGIQYVFSDLMPEDKLNILDIIRNKFGDVAMVGDGINDAPSIARANVGIAMGAIGSDVAIETADVALMQDDLAKLPYLFKLSRKTMTIIRQNIITAISVKLLFVILAILSVITLMMSVGIGDLGLTLLVILNSFRIGLIK